MTRSILFVLCLLTWLCLAAPTTARAYLEIS